MSAAPQAPRQQRQTRPLGRSTRAWCLLRALLWITTQIPRSSSLRCVRRLDEGGSPADARHQRRQAVAARHEQGLSGRGGHSCSSMAWALAAGQLLGSLTEQDGCVRRPPTCRRSRWRSALPSCAPWHRTPTSTTSSQPASRPASGRWTTSSAASCASSLGAPPRWVPAHLAQAHTLASCSRQQLAVAICAVSALSTQRITLGPSAAPV